MNTDILQGNWDQLKGKVKKHWGKLTDDDVSAIGGKKDELIGRLRTHYGYSKDIAEREIEHFLSSSKLSESINLIGEKIADSTESVKRNVEEYSNEVVDYIRECPMKSVAIAGAIGFVFGLFMRDRSS